MYKGLEAAGLINQDGTVNATALVNEHNRRNGSQNSVDNSVNGDYNYNTDDNTFEEGVKSGKQGGIRNSSRWIGQGNQNTQGRTGAVQETTGGVFGNGQEGRSFGGGAQTIRNQGSQRGLTKRQSEGLKTTKVKNADGTPKAVYHFTDNMEFTTFAKGDIGFHFGSAEQAYNRGKNLKKDGRIIKAYLDIKKPIYISSDIMGWKAANLAGKLYGDGILSKIDYLTVLELEKQSGADYDSPSATYLRQLLKEKGYDGIVYENMFEGKGESYIALYPEQVIIIDDGLNKNTEAGLEDKSAISMPEASENDNRSSEKDSKNSEEVHADSDVQKDNYKKDDSFWTAEDKNDPTVSKGLKNKLRSLFGKDLVSLVSLLRAMEPKHRRTFFEVIKDFLNKIKGLLVKEKSLSAQIDKFEKQFIKAYQSVSAEFEHQKTADNNGGEKFSIQKASDESLVVVVDTDQGIFVGAEPSEYSKIARQYFNEHFKNVTLPLGENDVVSMSKKMPGEYAYPHTTLDKNSPEYASKMKAITELDNLLKTAHNHSFSEDTK